MNYQSDDNGIFSTHKISSGELIIQAQDIRREHTGVHSKLSVLCQVNGNSKLLGLNIFNVGRDEERSRFGKKIHKQLRPDDQKNLSEKQLVNLLDEFCSDLWQAYMRFGEPVLHLCSTDEVGELEYLIYPIVPKDKPTFIFGDPGAGKSQLAGILNTIMILPWTDNELKLTAPQESTVCLELDYEADPDDMRRTLKKLSKGMNLGPIEMYYRRCSLPLIDDLEAIQEHIANINAKCMIVDSASLAAGGDLNHMDTAQSYIRGLRQARIASISLAHTSKDRDSKNKTIIGSVLFEAGARSVWECRGIEDEEHNIFDIALFHRKSNLSKKSKPLGYRLSFDNGGIQIQWHDPQSVPEFMERMSANQRVLEALKRGPVSSKDLEERLELSRAKIDVAIARLKKANKIDGDSKGWFLLVC